MFACQDEKLAHPVSRWNSVWHVGTFICTLAGKPHVILIGYFYNENYIEKQKKINQHCHLKTKRREILIHCAYQVVGFY